LYSPKSFLQSQWEQQTRGKTAKVKETILTFSFAKEKEANSFPFRLLHKKLPNDILVIMRGVFAASSRYAWAWASSLEKKSWPNEVELLLQTSKISFFAIRLFRRANLNLLT
jgi:formate dehydrogenase maturation protein FdhE